MLWVSGRADGHRQGELTALDGVVIPYREWWRPKARAVILYLHGQGDHSGPFTAMGDVLHEMGFNLYAHDHRGFGLSRERRGHIDSYERFIDDTLCMLGHARRQNPGLPAFILGLSMGGHLALRTAARAQREVSGVIALSPGFKLRQPPPWSLVVRVLLRALVRPYDYLPLPPSSAHIVTTRNQTHLSRAQDDEHWVTQFTGRFYVEAVRSIYKARREMGRLQVPALIMQAGDDYLVCPEESRRFYDRIAHPDKEFRLLEGLCHNLVAEPEMPQIAREIALWIDRHLPRLHLV
jgi:alpha-beta hydrolase superfamily lysophospholipase